MKLDKDALAMAILVAFESAALYSAFLPSWFTLSSPFFSESGATEGNVKRVREGEAIATVLSLGIALAVSRVSGSLVPLYATLAVDAVMVYGYERAMANPASQEG